MKVKPIRYGDRYRFVDEDSGQRVRGVTTFISNGVPKPNLVNWSANATIDYAIDHWAELDAMPPSEKIKTLSRARYEVTDKAKRRGSKLHRLAERLAAGERVNIPDGLEGYVQSYVRFLDEFGVVPVLTEAIVVSHTHGYGAILDLVGDLLDADESDGPSVRWLIEIKITRSGVFPEHALQLAGQRFADALVDPETGEESPIPDVDQTGVVWVRPNGYDLVPVIAGPNEHRKFLYAMQIAEFMEDGRSLIGDPIDPPRASTFRLIEEEDDGEGI